MSDLGGRGGDVWCGLGGDDLDGLGGDPGNSPNTKLWKSRFSLISELVPNYEITCSVNVFTAEQKTTKS